MIIDHEWPLVKLTEIFSNIWSSSSFSNLLMTFCHRYRYFSVILTLIKGPFKSTFGISNEEIKVKFRYFWEK